MTDLKDDKVSLEVNSAPDNLAHKLYDDYMFDIEEACGSQSNPSDVI